MQAKTNLQKQVVLLTKELPVLSKAQTRWAYKNCLEQSFFRGKDKSICFVCGNTWATPKAEQPKSCTCPNCKTRLKLRTSRKLFKDYSYFGIFTTCETFQVYRIFWVQERCRQRRPAERFISEVVQNWITPKGSHTVLAKSVNGMSMYMDQWKHDSTLEIKQYHHRHNVFPYKVYPRMKFIPLLTRNGFTGDLHEICPVDLFTMLLDEPKAELLLKSGQIPMLEKLCYQNIDIKRIEKNWPSIKICIRNKYLITDPSTWFDHMKMLRYFHNDVLNPHYVCPANFEQEHQRLNTRRNRAEQREVMLKRLNDMENEDLLYQEQKSPFLKLKLTDGEINIQTIKSVREFYDEGLLLNHCVYTGSYYSKPDALILSAKISGKPVETVEISLKEMRIIQSRGLDNEPTEFHERIISLVRDGIPKIRKMCV